MDGHELGQLAAEMVRVEASSKALQYRSIKIREELGKALPEGSYFIEYDGGIYLIKCGTKNFGHLSVDVKELEKIE